MMAINLKRRRTLQFDAALGLPVVAVADPVIRIATSHLPPLAVQDSPSMPGALHESMADAAYGNEAIVRRSLKGRPDEAEFELSKPLLNTVTWLAGSLDFSEA
jgi:hypothetical protein